MTVCETPRLRLREVVDADAPFILELVDSAEFRRWIGDRGVSDLASARRYIEQGPRASYARHGHGLWLVERRADGVPVGLCGLLKRDTLEDVDLGYALLARHAGAGYAREAAAAAIDWGRRERGLRRIAAIVLPDNRRSIAVLEAVGMRYERRLPPDGQGETLALYAWSAPRGEQLA